MLGSKKGKLRKYCCCGQLGLNPTGNPQRDCGASFIAPRAKEPGVVIL